MILFDIICALAVIAAVVVMVALVIFAYYVVEKFEKEMNDDEFR